jgi:hypothetical protein
MKRWMPVLAALAASAQAESGLRVEQVLQAVGGEVKPERAMTVMREVWERDRWFTFPKIEETARYLAKRLEAEGLNTQVVYPPADGVTQVGFWTMPLAWDVKQARLEVVDPEPPEEFRVLADYQKVPASLAMWSGPTAPGGITAELVDIGEGRRQQLEQADLQGKIALVSRRPSGIKWLLAQKGAIGAVSTYTENPDLKDAHDWVNSWGDRGWGVTKNNASLFCFTVTPRQAEWIRAQLAAGRKIRLQALVDSRYYEGSYAYMTALLGGDPGAEEVLMLGHTAEQGAQDNATGVAAMAEAMALLNRLIASGKLARPRRSIRMLAMGEVYGSMHYIVANPDRIRRTVAAICLDTPAGFYHLAGTEYTFYLNPHVASSYLDAFTMRLAQDYFSRLAPKRPFHEAPYTMGTDSFLSDPAIGVPTVWPYSSSGVHTHHNSEDTPDDVDPRSLRDLSVITAAFVYYLASAGEDEAAWLAELALTRAHRQMLASLQPFLDGIAAAQDRESLGRRLHDGLEQLAYAFDRGAQAVESVRRLAPQAEVAPLVGQLRAFRDQQAARLEQAASRRASRLGLGAVSPVPPPPDPKLDGADRMVVRRKRPGTLPLDDLAEPEREGWPSGAWDTRLATALYWCDGKRTLAEVVRLTRLELGPDNFDFAGYFRFLARKGYVELAEPGR